jgi:hypothetical protein
VTRATLSTTRCPPHVLGSCLAYTSPRESNGSIPTLLGSLCSIFHPNSYPFTALPLHMLTSLLSQSLPLGTQHMLVITLQPVEFSLTQFPPVDFDFSLTDFPPASSEVTFLPFTPSSVFPGAHLPHCSARVSQKKKIQEKQKVPHRDRGGIGTHIVRESGLSLLV